MAPTAVYPTVTLTRDQADALADWLWDLRGGDREEEAFRLMRLCVHLFDALERQADTYEIAVDPDVAWLATEILPGEVEEYAKPQLSGLLRDDQDERDEHLFPCFVDMLLEQLPGGTTKAEAEQQAREYLDQRLKVNQQQIAECQHFIAAAELLGCGTDTELLAVT